MSEPPRVEIKHDVFPDLDPSAPSNQTSTLSSSELPHSNGNANGSLANSAQKIGNSILETAQNAMSAASNHPSVLSAKDTVVNGPVGQNVQAEATKTRNEFADLANSRQIPEHKTATGQNLTHYHSMFYRLLSWKNPRATGIAFATTIVFILAARYLNIIRYSLKLLYLTLGVTVTAEAAGQLVFGRGLTSQFRPRQYFTIPKASLERLLDDVEQLINFFVIESQRIVFAENVYASGAAFFASLISYFLIKFLPFWGLSLIATLVTFLGPLIYIQNKEAIDAQLEKGRQIASQQATQIKGLANQHAGNAAKTVQGYTQQYTAKAQETINQYRGRSTSPEVRKSPEVKKEDFPVAPKDDLAVELDEKSATKPLVAEPAL
ncbi:Reticulon-domain-containing protein [Phaeosphaeriaceae sp. PMI808]|nr:Reticulon-domain-containing protein [Phaeosphaeriaceae sp. PMI808]